jgi:hypothetical protein
MHLIIQCVTARSRFYRRTQWRAIVLGERVHLHEAQGAVFLELWHFLLGKCIVDPRGLTLRGARRQRKQTWEGS